MPIQLVYDTAANLTSDNPTLAAGEQGYESDTGALKVGDGATAWNSLDYVVGKWQDFTPSWTNITVGNATQIARYHQVGKLVTMNVELTLGSTSSVTGSPQLTLPVTPASTFADTGFKVTLDDAGTSTVEGGTITAGGSNITIYHLEDNGSYVRYEVMSGTVPWTWTTSDVIRVSGTYEAA